MIRHAPPLASFSSPAVESSARIQPPALKVQPVEKPSVEKVEKPSAKSRKLYSGTGALLTESSDVEWERNKSGGFECWHSPPGATDRSQKVYLAYAGKKLLAEWENLTPAARLPAIEAWIREKRAGKVIN
ncbi:MAG: hypothetical protein AB7U82_08290 [Blastocatellales bacterium]